MAYRQWSNLFDSSDGPSPKPQQRPGSAAAPVAAGALYVPRLPSAGPGRGAGAQLPSFPVSPQRYGGLPWPDFKRPSEVDSFSLDGKRKFHHDRSMLRRYVSPDLSVAVRYDLNLGFDTFIERDRAVKEYLDDVLRCLTLNRRPLAARADFVCWRGLLTRALCMPYQDRDGWLVAAYKLGRTIYMCEFDEPESYPNVELMSYWGHKFEQYVTAGAGQRFPNTREPVNNHEGFYSVVTAALGGHSLLYGAEVDCIAGRAGVGREGDPLSTYLELKTNRSFDNARQERNFRKYKLVKWWAQCFLLAVPEVVCGFRDDRGVVHHLTSYRTDDMPDMAEGSDDSWDAAVCLNFLDDLLHFVKSTVTVPEQVYVFERKPGERCVTARRCSADEKSFRFMPAWYKDHCQQMAATAAR